MTNQKKPKENHNDDAAEEIHKQTINYPILSHPHLSFSSSPYSNLYSLPRFFPFLPLVPSLALYMLAPTEREPETSHLASFLQTQGRETIYLGRYPGR